MTRYDEERETEFEKFAEQFGISEMPPTLDDWLPETDEWEPGQGGGELPDLLSIALSVEDWCGAIGNLAKIEDEHLKVIWENLDANRPPYMPFVRRVRIQGWWLDEEGIESTIRRDEATALWHIQNCVLKAHGYNPIPAEEFFPLKQWAGWAKAMTEDAELGDDTAV